MPDGRVVAMGLLGVLAVFAAVAGGLRGLLVLGFFAVIAGGLAFAAGAGGSWLESASRRRFRRGR